MTGFVMPLKQETAIRRRETAGKTTLSEISRAPMFGGGPSQPRKNRVTHSGPITTITEFSARTNNAQQRPKYSARKPATNSASAFGQSNGARFSSADPSVTLRACR